MWKRPPASRPLFRFHFFIRQKTPPGICDPGAEKRKTGRRAAFSVPAEKKHPPDSRHLDKLHGQHSR